MNFSLFQTLCLRYIVRHPIRSLLIILSIALGVGTWVASDSLQSAMRQSGEQSANPDSGADLYISNDVTRWISRSIREKIEAVAGVKDAQPRVIQTLTLRNPQDETKTLPVRLIGLDLSIETGETSGLDASRFDVTITPQDIRRYINARLKRLFTNQAPPALVGQKLAETLKPGQEELSFLVGGKVRRIFVVGRIRARGTGATLDGNVIIMDGRDAATLLGQPDQVTRFDVSLMQNADRKAVYAELKKTIKTADVQTPESQNKRVQNLIRGMVIGFKICGAGALVVGLFLVFNALSINVVERRHDIGVLRSLGATRPQVRILFLIEALMLGILGTALGIPLGIGLAHASFGWMQQIYDGIFTRVAGGQIETTWTTLVTAGCGGIAVSLLAALLPASQAAAEEPADTVRDAPYVTGRAYRLLQIGFSIGLLLLGVLLLILKQYLSTEIIGRVALGLCVVGVVCLILILIKPQFKLWLSVLGSLFVCFGTLGWFFRAQLSPDMISFTGFVLIFLGVMLATPMLAALVTRLMHPLARAWLPVSSRLAADNLVRSPGRTGLVIVALTAGVALMVQTAGAIASNKSAMKRWLTQHYQADLFVTSGGPFSSAGLLTSMDYSFGGEASRLLPPGSNLVASSFRYPSFDSPTIGETRIFMTLLETRKHYRINKAKGSSSPYLDLYRQLSETPNGALVSENFTLMHKIKPGETLTIKGSEGPVKLKILGIIEEYQWSRGSIVVDMNQHRDNFRVRTAAQARNLAGTVAGLGAGNALGALAPLAYGGGAVDAFELYLPSNSDAPQIRESLLRELGSRYALVALTRPELRQAIDNVLDRLYGVAYAQELLVGIVAVLGVVTALLISVLARRRELGLIRAVGGHRGQILQTVLAEAVLIGLVGTLLGVLVGIPLEHYVVRVVLFDETGYIFPVKIPWLATGVIAALAMGCSILAGLGPAIHAMRLKITDAIAYE